MASFLNNHSLIHVLIHFYFVGLCVLGLKVLYKVCYLPKVFTLCLFSSYGSPNRQQVAFCEDFKSYDEF